jgi:hypothetical protein
MRDSATTESQNRKMGRPRNADRPVIPWEEVDRLLVFGETVRDEETGRETVRYPSHRDLGRRYGVSGALIGRYSVQHRCMERREENSARERISFEQKVVEKLAEARAMSTAEAIAIVDGYMHSFRNALDEGRVRTDSASDFNTMMRLKAYLEGKAESRHEVQGVITLEQMQERHRALRAQLESLDPAITGELPPRDRDRTRGLLVEGADGDQADRPPAASRHRDDRDDRDVKRAPRRRVVAHERDDEFVEDVPSADREESPRGNVRALRRRADRDDDIERVPRRRVMAYEREDELDDEALAAEREESPHGDAGARRRRMREYEDFDEDVAREPRRARTVKPADVRALRRRTREEIEDGRVSRRVQAMEPASDSTRRPRRPGREDRAKFPAVVDARRPGRGWEESERTEPGLRRPGRGWR